MYKVARRFKRPNCACRVLIVIAAFAGVARSEDPSGFCALTVDVTPPGPWPVRGYLYRLLNDKGAVEKSGRSVGPIVQICDFDFGLHQLEIGPNECHPVTIGNIFLTLGEPLRLKAVLNSCAGEGSRNYCSAYLRVKSDDGTALQGAVVSESSIVRVRGTTDGFGRVEIDFPPRTTIVLTVKANGHAAESVPITCQHIETVNKQVVLKKMQPRVTPLK